MPEQVHLLVNEPPQIPLARLLKAVKQTTSRKLRGLREKFWQERYYDSNVRGEKARSEPIRYIHRNPGPPAHERCALGCNPVKRGLVAKPEDWPWSSFRHSASGVKATVEIESQWTAFGRGNRLPERECKGCRVRWKHRRPAHRKVRDERGTALSCNPASKAREINR